MKTLPLMLALAVQVCTFWVQSGQAQIAASHIAESKQRFNAVRDNLQKIAEAMPEENYSFKPTPDIRSFGELIGHVLESQAVICSGATGKIKPVSAAKMTTRAELVSALKDSSAVCDAAFDGTTEANSTDAVSMGPMKLSRLGMLEYNTGHSMEEYGYLAVYVRLKGIVPPTTAAGANRSR